MDKFEKFLEPINGCLVSIRRNPVDGWYELEVGIPIKWAISGNALVDCEVIQESEKGKLIKISPTSDEIGLDKLVEFVKLIVKTNKKIADKEASFAKKMDDIKKNLEKEANNFYKELDDMKENSFKELKVGTDLLVVKETKAVK